MVGKRKDLSKETVELMKDKLRKISKSEFSNICKLYETVSIYDIKSVYEVNYLTIKKILLSCGVKLRNRKEAQQLYLKYNDERSLKQSEFMKHNNPMDNLEARKKCSQPKEKNAMWKPQKIVICSKCGKKRVLKQSRYDMLILKDLCWNCYHHSRPKSSLEIKFAKELTKNNITFEEQVNFHGMFLDFLLPNKVVVEVDGIYWHNLPENKERDLRKNKLLKEKGYKLFRFTDKEINDDVDGCVKKILGENNG